MDIVSSLLGIARFSMLAIIVTLFLDYKKFSERYVLCMAWIGLLFLVNEVFFWLNIYNFIGSIYFYLTLDLLFFGVSALIAIWGKIRAFYRPYIIVNGVITAAIFVVMMTLSLINPNDFLRGANETTSVVARAIIAGHAAISLIFALYCAGSSTNQEKIEIAFLSTEKDFFIFGTGFLFIALLPNQYTYEFALFFTFVMYTVFALQYRAFLYDELNDIIFTRDKEQTVMLDLFYKISNAIAENEGREATFSLITSSATQTTEAVAGALFTIDKTERALQAQTVDGLFPPVYEVNDYVRAKTDRVIKKLKGDRIKIDENNYLSIVARTGEPLLIVKAIDDERVPQTMEGYVDVRSVIAVPLKIQDEVLGVLAVINKESGRAFTQNDLSLMLTLADQTAVSINNIRLYEQMLEKERNERDVSIAGEIQRKLFPETAPEVGAFRLHSYSFAAKGVGGDFYDYLDLGDGRVAIIIVDVAGKGVPASLVMVMIRSTWHLIAPRATSPAEAIAAVNNSIVGDLTDERYATMFYCVFDTKTNTLHYANAAHGPLQLYRAKTGKFEELDTDGLPVGITKSGQYEDKKVTIQPGDILALYTDGITEAMSETREQYSLERLRKQIHALSHKTPEEISTTIYDDIERFVGDAPQHDDETLIIMKLMP